MAANNGSSPGDPGTTVGQIKTPMCSENVGRMNTPTTHDYSKATGIATTSGSDQIEGPGVAGTGGSGLNSPGITIKGSNKKGRW